MKDYNITNYVTGCWKINISKPWQISFPYFHLISVLSGELYCTYRDHTYHAACYQLAGAADIRFYANDCTAIHLALKPELLLDYLNDTYFFTRDAVTLPPKANIRLCQSVFRYASLDSHNRQSDIFSKTSTLYEILQILKDYSPDRKQTMPKASLGSDIISYIRENYNSNISQAGTAKYFHVTPQHLSRVMNHYTGRTFSKYLTEVRIEKAKDYLHYTHLSVKNICERTHLSADSPIFYDALDKCDQTPKLYHTFGTVIPSSGSMEVPFSHPVIPCNAPPSGTLYNITADMGIRKPFPAFWKKLINLGYASELKSLRIEPQLEILRDKIGFTYGRICRITDLITWYSTGSRKIHNYISAFSLLDVVIKNRLLPFLELGNKIFLIQTTTSHALVFNSTEDSALYYDKLLKLLPEFIRACISRYGQECFDNWIFEVSYTFTDPDELKNFKFTKYVGYFQKIYNIIRSYSPVCQIGGPGFNDWEYTEHLPHYLNLFAQVGCIPDFFSAYLYSIDRMENQQYIICADASIIKKRLQLFQTAVSRMFPGKRIWITEFNSNLSSRNHWNDLSCQAAFLAKTILETLSCGVEAMGYYLLSDAPLRYSDTLDFLFGGWGLFTDSNIPKPSCHTYRMLSLLGNYLVKYSKNYILTANSNASFQILVAHYAHPSEKYLYENIQKEDIISNDATLFAPTPHTCFHFRLLHVPPGDYLVKEYRISHKHSNLFYEWAKINFLTPARQWDIDDLSRLSLLSPQLSVQSVDANATFVLDCQLDSPEVRLYLIEQYSAF